jgi:hypothetical protein
MDRAIAVLDQAKLMFNQEINEVRNAGYPIEGGFWTVLPAHEILLLQLAREVVGFRAKLHHFYNTSRSQNPARTPDGDEVTVVSDRYWTTRIAYAQYALATEIGELRTSLSTGDQVTVYLNNNSRDATTVGYQRTDTVTNVFAYPVRSTDDHVLEQGFRLLNVGHELGHVDDRAVAYRDRFNRSVSIGDVLAVDSLKSGTTTFYACHRGAGWVPIEPPTVVQRREPGVTPIEDDLTPR